jgi:hypothetical protein
MRLTNLTACAFLIAGVTALAGGCGSDAKPPPRDAGSDTAPGEDAATPDGPGRDSALPPDGPQLLDGAAPDRGTGGADGGQDAAPLADGGDDGATPTPDAEPGDDAEAPDSGGPDLPPVMGPLLGHWPFDDGTGTAAADTSGNAGTGTLENGATWSTSGFPSAMFANAGAVVLDGIDDFVELGTRAIPANNAPKTISVWFYIAAPAGAGRQNIVALTNDELTTGVGTQMGLDGGKMTVWLLDDPQPLLIAPAAAAAGWHHLAYTFDGTTHRLYADGQPVGDIARALPVGPVVTARVGGFDVPMLEMFGGRVDDLRIYDHALDAPAIATLAAGGSP